MKTILSNIPEDVGPLLPSYLARRSEEVGILKDCLMEKQFDECKAIGHRLKGCGTSYGFPYISELGRQIETTSQNQDLEMLRLLVQDLEREVKELVRELPLVGNTEA